jgi:hypothetical protein
MTVAVLSVGLALLTACGGGPASSSDSPATLLGQVSGMPVAGGASASAAGSSTSAAVTVTVEENAAITTTVGDDGTFRLSGLPADAFTLVFRWSGRESRLRLTGVEPGQRIAITVRLEGGRAVLLEDERDGRSESTCARGAGFWCQNQDGRNPNMSAGEFQQRAERAAELLAAVPHLNTAREVAAAVCDTGDQLSRQLATLALNLAAGLVNASTPLRDESFRGSPLATVGDALAAAIRVANGSLAVTRGERNELKDVLERINENENTDSPCGSDEDDTDEDDSDDDGGGTGGQMTICHIPPGNPKNAHTITVGVAAWPAHKAHGDYEGACR